MEQTPSPPTTPAFHPKVKWFAQDMQTQLRDNAPKGDWEKWQGLNDKLIELEYHKAKLLIALRGKNKSLIREYLADCGNILMFIGNEIGLYEPMSVESIQIGNLFSNEANAVATVLIKQCCQQILDGADRQQALQDFRRRVGQLEMDFPEAGDSDVRDSMAYYLDLALIERGHRVTSLDDLRG